MDTSYSQSGNWIAFAGLAVMGLAKIGIITDSNTVVSIVAGIVAFIGIVRQYLAHRKLGIIAGGVRQG